MSSENFVDFFALNIPNVHLPTEESILFLSPHLYMAATLIFSLSRPFRLVAFQDGSIPTPLSFTTTHGETQLSSHLTIAHSKDAQLEET